MMTTQAKECSLACRSSSGFKTIRSVGTLLLALFILSGCGRFDESRMSPATNELLDWDHASLMELYRSIPNAGPIPEGKTEGAAIGFTNLFRASNANANERWQAYFGSGWRGKTFQGDSLTNRIHPYTGNYMWRFLGRFSENFELPWFPAAVSYVSSAVDGNEAIAIDYWPTIGNFRALPFTFFYDEIRMHAEENGVYSYYGPTYLRFNPGVPRLKVFILWFFLDATDVQA